MSIPCQSCEEEKSLLRLRLSRMGEVLKKIEEWDEHPVEWKLMDKINYYRRIAGKALEEDSRE